MVESISGVKFQGNPLSLKNNQTLKAASFQSNKLLRQPVKDEVAFTGAVLNPSKLIKIAKNMGWSVVQSGGRHPLKINNVPIPTHGGGGDIATGTANAIAKELGFKNVYELLKKL